jgi:hypothetical protein
MLRASITDSPLAAKPFPTATKVYRRNHLQSANFVVILLCRGLRGSQEQIPSAERPWARSPQSPASSLGEPSSGGRNPASKGSTKMTAMNDEPRSRSDMGRIAPARRLPPASPTAGGLASPIPGGPAGLCRGCRATKARGRVSSKMPGLLTTPAGWLGGSGRLPRCLVHAACLQAKEVQPRGSPGRDPGQPYRGPWDPLSGGRYTFRGNENKPLTAISNRNSNDSRKRATLSEPTTSKFLIATKTHLSEEKAKREQKAKMLGSVRHKVIGGGSVTII